jgi:hypothetical protein
LRNYKYILVHNYYKSYKYSKYSKFNNQIFKATRNSYISKDDSWLTMDKIHIFLNREVIVFDYKYQALQFKKNFTKLITII